MRYDWFSISIWDIHQGLIVYLCVEQKTTTRAQEGLTALGSEPTTINL